MCFRHKELAWPSEERNKKKTEFWSHDLFIFLKNRIITSVCLRRLRIEMKLGGEFFIFLKILHFCGKEIVQNDIP
jgi:hypothetical protein